MEKNKELLDQINKQGYILEERAEKILESLYESSKDSLKKIRFLERNHIIYDGENETEIDLLLVINNTCFVIECKKSEKSWFFGFNEKSNDQGLSYLHLDSNKPGIFWDMCDSEGRVVAKPFFSALADEQGGLKPISKKREFQISQRDIDSVLRQSARNVYSVIKDKGFVEDLEIKYFKQIVVTNSDLFSFEYNDRDINSKGDLTKIKNLTKQKHLICNRKEPIKIRDPVLNSNNAVLSTIWTNLDNLKEIVLNETMMT